MFTKKEKEIEGEEMVKSKPQLVLRVSFPNYK